MIIFSDDVEYNRVTLEHSAWADGFTDVLSYGHTSDDYDNPYHEPTERVCYDSYIGCRVLYEAPREGGSGAA